MKRKKLDSGDEVVSTLTKFAKDKRISAAHFTAISACSGTGIGYLDWQKKYYLKNQVNEQVEVLSLIGDIALDGCTPKVHAHVVVGKKNRAAMDGDLLEAHVRRLELLLQESAYDLKRKFDPKASWPCSISDSLETLRRR